jgi:electron transport complex protein RnfE
MLTALQNKFNLPSATNKSGKNAGLACNGDCAHCSGETFTANHNGISKAKDVAATVENNTKKTVKED